MGIIVIDPGHSGSDPGASDPAGQISEAKLVLPYALELGAALTRRGHNVLLTRHAEETVSLSERAALANEAKADLFISVHANASTSPHAKGPWSIHAKGSERGRSMAETCQKALAGVLGGRGNAVYPDGSPQVGHRTLAVLRQTKMPAVLLELGFMTHRGDLVQLMDQATPHCVAEALAAAIDAELANPND